MLISKEEVSYIHFFLRKPLNQFNFMWLRYQQQTTHHEDIRFVFATVSDSLQLKAEADVLEVLPHIMHFAVWSQTQSSHHLWSKHTQRHFTHRPTVISIDTGKITSAYMIDITLVLDGEWQQVLGVIAYRFTWLLFWRKHYQNVVFQHHSIACPFLSITKRNYVQCHRNVYVRHNRLNYNANITVYNHWLL